MHGSPPKTRTLRLQHDALTDGGCEKLFRVKLSGTSTTLPAREKLLAFARKGDVVVVWKLDRFGRSRRSAKHPDRRNTTSPKPIRCTSLFRPAKRTPTGASWRG